MHGWIKCIGCSILFVDENMGQDILGIIRIHVGMDMH